MSLRQAEHLYQLSRYPEAIAAIHIHLANEPEDVHAHTLLALSRYQAGDELKEALKDIQNAIRLEPEDSELFSIQTEILVSLGRPDKALRSAEEAIALDPGDSYARLAKAQAYLCEENWFKGEKACREALELDPDNLGAQNLLATCLRLQGKTAASLAEAEYSLSQNPEDSYAHSNLGWSYLQQNKREKAEEHFRESLRLDPTCELSRRGLLDSFRARSPFYRLYLKWIFFLSRFSGSKQTLFIIGIFIGYQVLSKILAKIDPRLMILFVILYLFFILGSYLLRGIGNLSILCDRSARYALTQREKLEGFFVGGFTILGILIILSTFLFPSAFLLFLGVTLFASALLNAMFWTNPNKLGRWIFGSSTLVVTSLGLIISFSALLGEDLTATYLITPTLFILFATTWLNLIPQLKEAEIA